MHIDEPGHQGATTAIDHGRARSVNWLGRNLLDRVAFDQYVAGQPFFANTIKYVNIGKQCLFWCFVLCERE